MGTRYDAMCKSCNHEFELVKGGGFNWYQKICNTCGQDMRVPRKGPEVFQDGITLTYLELAKHLADGPSMWSRRGGRLDDVERKILDEMTSVCSCGGAMISETSKDATYRCPKCKSPDLDLGNYVLFD